MILPQIRISDNKGRNFGLQPITALFFDHKQKIIESIEIEFAGIGKIILYNIGNNTFRDTYTGKYNLNGNLDIKIKIEMSN